MHQSTEKQTVDIVENKKITSASYASSPEHYTIVQL
jgi:hypothetical protein